MTGNDLSHILGTAELVGQSPVFKQVVEQIVDLARANVVVLITGETGTGKELCARAIHHLGKRRNLPFIPVDCASLPDHLFENEMFGHVRGAYTDARQDQKGLIALADGGTLLLDEIDALSPSAQGKLLRFLQERTYRSLGAERFVRADVNVIAASNRELDSCVAAGTFRSDLFFRLNVFRLHLPPLRERHSDIRMLALHFLQRLCADRGQHCKNISPAALRALEFHTWPGNVRELHNLVQRAVVIARGEQILPCHLQIPTSLELVTRGRKTFRDARAFAIAEFERHFLIDLLRRHGGNITQAARDAGKDRRALGRLVKKYSLRSSLATGQL
jgi:DNA-binding NtrC family response regulator